MADARYIIDLILKARDDTGRAVQSAISGLNSLEKQQERLGRQTDELAQKYDRAFGKIATSEAQLREQRKALNAITDEGVRKQIELQKASENYARTLQEQGRGTREAVTAYGRMIEAEKALVKQIQEENEARKEGEKVNANAEASAIKLTAVKDEQAKIQTKIADDVAKAEQQAARDTADVRAALLRQELAQAQEAEAKRQATFELQQERNRREAQAERDLADVRAALHRQEQDQADEAEARRQANFQARENQRERELQAEREFAAVREHLARREQAQAEEAESRRIANWEAQEAQRQREIDALEAQAEAERQAARERAERERQYQSLLRETANAQRQARIGIERGAGQEIQAKFDLDAAEARAQLAELAAEIAALDGREIDIQVDLDAARFLAESRAVRAEANDSASAFAIVREAAGRFGEALEGGSNRIAAFDNLIRGVFTLLITVFLPQLVQVGGAAVGMLFALAASAAQAGAALGGALVAGIAQAIPVLGVLGTALSRVKGVLDAVKQANLLNEQQSYKGAAADNAAINAAEAVADAHRRVADAQERLTEARADARRQLEDLIMAEKEAALAARGAALSQEEAQRALRAAIATGRTEDVERAQLRVDEADLGRIRADRRAGRARTDARTARAGGVEGMPGVQRAKEALVDAERGARRAARSAEQAEAGITAAAGKLNYLLAGMSAAERRFYEAVLRLSETWKGFAKDVSAPLINSFTNAVGRVTRILQDDRMVSAARTLSSRMGRAFDRVFGAFTSPEMLRNFRFFADEAGKNLGPVTTIITRLGRAFANIGRAASPALKEIIESVRDLAIRFDDFIAKSRESGQLGKFFEDGVKHLKSWADLMWQIVRLFAAIAGAGGAEEGKKGVDDLGNSIEKAADKIGKAGSTANKFWREFFETSRATLDELKPIFTALADEFGKTFNKDGVSSVRGFAAIMSEVLIPAAGGFIRALGRMTTLVGNWVRANPDITKLAATFLGLSLTFGAMYKVVSLLLIPIRSLVGLIGFGTSLGRAMKVAAAEGGKFSGTLSRILATGSRMRAVLLGPWGALGALLVVLMGRFGRLDNLWRAITTAAQNFFSRVKGPFKELQESIQGLIDGFGGDGGLMPVIQLLVTVISGVLGGVIVTFGKIVGNVVGGIFKLLSGVIDIFTGIVTLDFGKLIGGLSKVGEAIVQGILAPLGNLFGLLTRPFRRAVAWILDFLGISSPSKKFAEIGEAIVDGIWEGIKDIGRLFVRAFRRGINAVEDFLGGAGNRLAKLGEKIVGGIVEGIKKAPGALKKAVEDLMKKIPGAKTVLGALDKLGVTRNKGGPIPGTGNTDSVPAMLTPGEHVWTKEEVQRAGGHRMMFLLRALFGGGKQGGPRGYAFGGEVRDTGSASAKVSAQVNVDADDKNFARRWRLMWQEVVASTRRNSALVQIQLREMRVGIERTMIRLSREFHERWRKMSSFAVDASEDMWRGVRRNVMNMQNTVFRGMTYIGSATNAALKSFDADPIKLRIPRPAGAETRASGGYVGSQGERGRDAIWALLGRGEAVLNHWQQRAVQSQLPAGVSLQDIITRTRGYHAGGPNAPGFAGGYAGQIPGNGLSVPIPGAPGEFIAKRIVRQVAGVMRRFKMAATDGFAVSGHATNSDHYKGLAVDLVPGAGGNWDMVDKAAAWAKAKLGSVFRWIGYDGVPNHGRGHHLHLSWLSDAAGIGAMMIDQIKRLRVLGDAGPLRSMVQKAMDSTRKAANRTLDGQMDSGVMETTGHPVGEGLLGRGEVMSVINRAMEAAAVPEMIRASWRSMAYRRARQESGFNPNAVNNWDINAKNGDPSRGLFQTIGATFRAFAGRGMSNILNPLHNAVAAFRYMFSRYGGGKSWSTALQRMLGREGVGYATGGIIPGDYDGAPQPILAHAGEWIVNRAQQSKLAALAGTGVGKLRAALGFTGGPTSFQGGGEVTETQARLRNIRRGDYDLPVLSPIDLSGIRREIERFRRAQRNLRKNVTNWRSALSQFTSNISALTDEDGLLAQIGRDVDRVAQASATRISLARAGYMRARRGLQGLLRPLARRARPLDESNPRDAARLADMEIEGLAEQRAGIREQRDTAADALGAVQKRIERVRGGKGGVTKKEEAQYQKLLAERQKLIDTINGADADYAENIIARNEALKKRFEAQTERAMADVTKKLDEIDFFQGIADALGAGAATQRGLSEQRVTALTQQMRITEQRAQEAAARGYTDMAAELTKSANQIFTTIQQEVVKQQQMAIDLINQTAERSNRRLEFASRLAEIRGAFDPVAAARLREGISAQRGGVLSTQRAGLVAQLGGEAAFRALKDLPLDILNDTQKALAEQIEELDVAVQENSMEQRELQNATREATIARINDRTAFGTGVTGSLTGILQKLGEATGQVNTQAITNVLTQTAGFLNTQAAGLREQFGQLTGIALALDPAQLVPQLQGILTNWQSITQGMTETEQATLRELVNSILGNTDATLENNAQLAQVTAATDTQDFSSSAWRWFRQAIFTGAGQLMPQYQIPQMHNGGIVTRSGIFELQAGEKVATRQQSAAQTFEFNIQEAGPETDYTYLASRVAMATRTPST